ncbi:hypothetical protein COU74_04495 [Candidatus Peregrinibacteria bacterium CG10_big_fil_rev_8_21_14_0_10_36_19]|nr:MAG: hypothetical protein COU74_04495 [Candidatus Peregrinibacteria bacterium CG10_big_fil_rev_8_21_14_0_10_36_19]
MMDFIVFKHLVIALALSLLLGLEREKSGQSNGGAIAVGIRTYTLIGLIGALSYVLADFSVVIAAVLAVGVFSLVIASYVSSKDKGLTSEVATVVVYIVGILSMMGEIDMAITVTLATLGILHFKSKLHLLSKRVKNLELTSALKFILIAFVVLPLLPNQNYGPYEFFNPYLVWLMVVFVSGLSFLSYFAIKFFGTRKGIGLSGFLGGFISTTALALSFADNSKKTPRIVNPYVFAMMVAVTGMFVRVLIEVSVVNSELLKYLFVPVVAMGVVTLVMAFLFWIKRDGDMSVKDAELRLESPFSLISAMKFGALFGIILFFVKFASAVLGDTGLYITSVVSGTVDIDSITISVANLAGKSVDFDSAAMAIIIAIIVNNLSKSFILLFLGSKKVGMRVLIISLVASVVGVGSLVLL